MKQIGIVMVFAMLGCASVEHSANVDKSALKARDGILDVKFESIYLHNVRMDDALMFLGREIRESLKEKNAIFPWAIVVREDSWDAYKYKNPRVNIEGTNISLRSILDTLCAQSGWTYQRMYGGPRWVEFTPPPR